MCYRIFNARYSVSYTTIKGRRRFSTVHELTVKTGKYKADVMAALDVLVSANYIQWDDRSDTATMVILEGWEREEEKTKSKLPHATINNC
ncbi:hypothetical protein GCM10008014_12620 [Paenibacillus silvae]|uniref:Uncharacterized protein n=1 Tax=Paenibacillus silvae TaxID=1325358 RepID=A0ABQ1Z5V6_9BACL|nr:hypothetical protein GCM10008014_12620 [Paenibacillus silvae]